jgi:importin-5
MQNIPEDNLATVLQSFHALASVHPIVFLPHIETLLPFLLRVSLPANPEETASSDSPAQPAFELLLTLVDNKPAFFRKYTTASGEGFVHAAAQVAIQLVAAIENPEDWGQEDGDETEEDGEWSVWGEECLDRIACALGGKAVLPPVWPMVESLLQGENRGWKERYAGLLWVV